MNGFAFQSKLAGAVAIVVLLANAAAGQKDSIVARVNGETVTAREVEREVGRIVGRKKTDGKIRERIRAGTIPQLIDRRLVHQWLDRAEQGATRAEIDQQAQSVKRDLADRKRDWTEHLKGQGLTDDEWRRDTAWRIAWSRYVAEQYDDASLKKYFERRRRDFDGTEIRVRHLLLRADGGDSAPATEKLLAKAAAIRDDIIRGRLTFEEAVRRHSQAPTKDTGGDLGFITRHGEQVEAFSKAAFALEKDQISPPVVTPFGVHLIQCVDIKPGKKKLDDVREDVLRTATAELFRERAASERKNAKIEYVK